MQRAIELCDRFGGRSDAVVVGVGNPNGWGWADAVLATVVPTGENPYEYSAYDSIRDEWSTACEAVERGDDGADEHLRNLIATFADAFN